MFRLDNQPYIHTVCKFKMKVYKKLRVFNDKWEKIVLETQLLTYKEGILKDLEYIS